MFDHTLSARLLQGTGFLIQRATLSPLLRISPVWFALGSAFAFLLSPPSTIAALCRQVRKNYYSPSSVYWICVLFYTKEIICQAFFEKNSQQNIIASKFYLREKYCL